MEPQRGLTIKLFRFLATFMNNSMLFWLDAVLLAPFVAVSEDRSVTIVSTSPKNPDYYHGRGGLTCMCNGPDRWQRQ